MGPQRQQLGSILHDMGLKSVVGAAMLTYEPADLVEQVRLTYPGVSSKLLGWLPGIWTEAQIEAQCSFRADAKARRVAQRYSPMDYQPPSIAPLRLVHHPAQHIAHPGGRRGRATTVRASSADQDIKAADKLALEDAIDKAMHLSELAGHQHARRLRSFRDSHITSTDARALLSTIFCKKVTVAETLLGLVRGVYRFIDWCAGKGYPTWTATPVQITLFLRESAERGRTVPRTMYNSLEWFDNSVQIGWDLADDMVQAQAGAHSRQAMRDREQAQPWEIDDINAFIDKFKQEARRAPQGRQDMWDYVYILGFFLTLAFAVLRFSDLHHSEAIKINRDAVYGVSHRSKKKTQPFPWAAIRRTWDDYDWGAPWIQSIAEVLPDLTGDTPRAWMWPRTTINGDVIEIPKPAQRGGYHNCLTIFQYCLLYTSPSPRDGLLSRMPSSA